MTVSAEGSEKELVFNCVHKAMPYLRLSYCNVVDVVLRGLVVDNLGDLRGVILDDLATEHTSVRVLNVVDDHANADVFRRVTDAFASVESLKLDWRTGKMEQRDTFDDRFFGSLALRGVLTCNLHAADYRTAIAACGFLGDTGGIECRLSLEGYSLMDDFEVFLVKLLEKASTIEAGTRIEFEFLIDFTSYLADNDFDGAEFVEIANGDASPYTARVWTMGNRWIIDDLKNGIQCEIELFDKAEVEGPIKMLQIVVCSKH